MYTQKWEEPAISIEENVVKLRVVEFCNELS